MRKKKFGSIAAVHHNTGYYRYRVSNTRQSVLPGIGSYR